MTTTTTNCNLCSPWFNSIHSYKAFDISTDRQTLSNYLELVKFMNGIWRWIFLAFSTFVFFLGNIFHTTVKFIYSEKATQHTSVKFIHHEKATQFCKISTLDLTVCSTVKSKVEISQNLVAFSEYMNSNFKAKWENLSNFVAFSLYPNFIVKILMYVFFSLRSQLSSPTGFRRTRVWCQGCATQVRSL